MDETILSAFYYGISKYYGYMVFICQSFLQKNPGISSIALWRAIGLFLSDPNVASNEYIRELKSLVNDRDCCIAALIALMKVVETGLVTEDSATITSKLLETMRKPQNERAYLNACLLCHLFQQSDDALRLFKLGDQHCSPEMKLAFEALQLWMASLKSPNNSNIERYAGKMFDLLRKDQKNIWVLASYCWTLKSSDPTKTLDVLAKASVLYPSCFVFKVEKLRVELLAGIWDAIPDGVGELNALHASKSADMSVILMPIDSMSTREHLESILVMFVYYVVYKSDLIAAESQLKTLKQVLTEKEGNNVDLIVFLMDFLVSISQHPPLLSSIYDYGVELMKRFPLNSEVLSFVARCLYEMKEYKRSSELYGKLISLNGSNLDAVEQKLMCALHLGNLGQLGKEIDFICEVKASNGGQTCRVNFLKFMFIFKSSGTKPKQILQNVLENYWSIIKDLNCDYNGYRLLNFHLGSEIISHALEVLAADSSLLVLIDKVIGKFTELFPGNVTMLKLSASLQMKQKNNTSALNLIIKAKKIDPNNFQVGVKHAEILLESNQAKAALDVLEHLQVLNFEVRNDFTFIMIKAKACRIAGQLKSAEEQIELAQKKISHSNQVESIELLLERSDLAIAAKDYQKAKQLLRELEALVAPSSAYVLEMKMRQFEVELLIGSDNVDHLLAIVQQTVYTSANEQFYRYSREKAAQIFLERKNDKTSYIRCYQELAQNIGKFEDFMSLAGAFKTIGDTDKSQLTYESIMYKFPEKELQCTLELAMFLINEFQLEKALYLLQEKSKKFTESIALKYYAAAVLVRMYKFEEAKQVLEYSRIINRSTLSDIGYGVLCLGLLGDIYNESVSTLTAIKTYKESMDCLKDLMAKFGSESDVNGTPASELMMQIKVKLAKAHDACGEKNQAIIFYNDALAIEPKNIRVLNAYSNLLNERGDYDSAQMYCSVVLGVDPFNKEALALGANVLFKQRKFKESYENLKSILTTDPTNWEALWMYIEVVKRSQSVDSSAELDSFFLRAEKSLCGDIISNSEAKLGSRTNSSDITPSSASNSRPTSLLFTSDSATRAQFSPGYLFCRGVYYAYKNRMEESVKTLIEAKYDQKYADLAIQMIADIYLNFDLLGKGDGNDFSSEIDRTAGIAVIRSLLTEFPVSTARKTVLEAGIKLLSNTKPEFEKIMANLQTLISIQNTEYHVIYMLSLFHVRLRQHSKAKSLLQKIYKHEVSIQNIYDYEKCLFLYADLLMLQPSKNESVGDVLNDCLKLNGKSVRIYEMLGMLKEKEGDFVQAAKKFELAWKYSNERNYVIGAKLALANFKAKRYIEAIDVSRVVYENDGNAKIKEILEKARSCLKV